MPIARSLLLPFLMTALAGAAAAQQPSAGAVLDDAAARLQALRLQLADAERQIDALRQALAAQQSALDGPRSAAPAPAAADPQPRAVAPIFEQPGVLTPAGQTVVEPSLQYSYSSSNRIALAGTSIIPAVLVGRIDVREVKRNTVTGALALRHGVDGRFEVEAKLPYVHRSDSSVGREVLESSSAPAVFSASGRGIGDVEGTARLQLNSGDGDWPYVVGSLRVKSRTGRDPFEVPVSTGVVGFRGDGIQTELPTGSGFWGVQPALSLIQASDPAVFFGSVSWLHSVKRHDVVRSTDQGQEELGTIAPGGIFGFNVGMGLALNERSSFSIGYDHASVGRTRQNGQVVADSVRVQLGTLLLGYAWRIDERRSLNLSLGAGLTRDTPDLSLTLRLPSAF